MEVPGAELTAVSKLKKKVDKNSTDHATMATAEPVCCYDPITWEVSNHTRCPKGTDPSIEPHDAEYISLPNDRADDSITAR